MPEKNIPNSGNQALDVEIENLLGIDSSGHTDSTKFNKLTDALTALSACIAKYYPKDISTAPQLNSQQLYEINDAYVAAIRECNNYTSGKGTSRRSGYGQARLKTVMAIKQVLDKDLLTLQDIDPKTKPTLPWIIRTARTDDVRLLPDEADLKVVGGNSSSRIPMSINTVAGKSEGFFTEDYNVVSMEDMYKELCSKYDMRSEQMEKLFMKTIIDGKFYDQYFGYAIECFDEARIAIEADNISKEELIHDTDVFKKCFEYMIDDLSGEEPGAADNTFNILAGTEEKRRRLLDVMDDTLGMADEHFGSHTFSNITLGQNIPNRNVGMSRVADLLGMSSLVAKATRMDVKDNDGYVRKGVFQEAAKGSDINHLQQNDPLYAVGDHPELMDDPNILKQIADLQVLDYICGNTDRHQGNMLYQMKEVDGQIKFVGIKGIDNDRSFGLFTENDSKLRGFITPPEMMRVISKSAMDSLLALDKDKLSVALKDLHFEDNEIDACVKRRNDIINAYAKGKITMIQDKDFKRLTIDDLAFEMRYLDSAGKTHDKYNHFALVADIRNSIMQRVPDPSGPIKFNEAESLNKEHARVNFKVSMRDLTSDRDSLKYIEDDFVKTDRALHINSGGYKWMLSSLRTVKDEITELEKKYGPDDELSAEDAKRIDNLYRAMRKASNDYLADHKDPSSTMGKTRKFGAEFMSSLHPMNADLPHVRRIIRESSIGKLEEKVNSKKTVEQPKPPEKKERITKRSVAKKAAKKTADNPAANAPMKKGSASSSSSANLEWSM